MNKENQGTLRPPLFKIRGQGLSRISKELGTGLAGMKAATRQGGNIIVQRTLPKQKELSVPLKQREGLNGATSNSNGSASSGLDNVSINGTHAQMIDMHNSATPQAAGGTPPAGPQTGNQGDHRRVSSLTNHELSALDIESSDRQEIARCRTEIALLRAQLAGKDKEIEKLKGTLEECQVKLVSHNHEEKRALVESVSQRLCKEYNEKHQRKIALYKRNLETKYKDMEDKYKETEEKYMQMEEKYKDTIAASVIAGTSPQSNTNHLTQQLDDAGKRIAELEKLVAQERQEKSELVTAYDTFVSLLQDQERKA